MSDSRARLSQEKHSMSSMCTYAGQGRKGHLQVAQSRASTAHLIDEEHSWNKRRLSLFAPLSHLGVNLLADLWVQTHTEDGEGWKMSAG